MKKTFLANMPSRIASEVPSETKVVKNMKAEIVGAQNSITLSFNGVDFRLIPSGSKSNSKKSNISLSSINGEYTSINLESFTGTLVVSGAVGNEIVNQSVTRSPKDKKADNICLIDDEPNTPESSVLPKEVIELDKGQQQISFERKAGKKRVSFIVCYTFSVPQFLICPNFILFLPSSLFP